MDPYNDPITMNPGNPNGDETLLGILQRLRDISAQPMVPDNPLAQLGTIFQGFASGTQGQANPALKMFADQRQQATQGLMEQATVQGALNSEKARQTQQDMERRRLQLETVKGFPDTSPESRTYKYQALQTLAKAQGLDIPTGLITGLIAGQVTPQKLEEVSKLVVRGYAMAPGGKLTGVNTMSDSDIAKALDMAPELVSQTRQAFLANPDAFLSSIGKKTLTQLAQEEADLIHKNTQAMMDTNAPELQGNMTIKPYVILGARKLFQKEYWNLSTPERDKAIAYGANAYAQDQGEITGERAFQAALGRLNAIQNAPGSAKDYFNANPPYQPLSSSTSLATAQALEATQGATHVPNKADQQSLKYVNQLKVALDEYRDAVKSLPEYFPPETGNQLKDLGSLGVAAARFNSGAARTDPRTVPLTAMKRHIVNLGRISGTGARLSNFVAELEAKSGGFDTVAGQNVKLGLANQVETFLNSQLEAMGFNPLPKYIPGKIVRLSTGKVVRILPDGTQYVIGAQE